VSVGAHDEVIMAFVIILALAAFQLTLLLLPPLSIRRLAYSVLLVLVGGCIYEAIVFSQMPVENNPIRIDLLFFTPFVTSYAVYAALGFLRGLMPSLIRPTLVKGLLFVCDCTIVTGCILL